MVQQHWVKQRKKQVSFMCIYLQSLCYANVDWDSPGKTGGCTISQTYLSKILLFQGHLSRLMFPRIHAVKFQPSPLIQNMIYATLNYVFTFIVYGMYCLKADSEFCIAYVFLQSSVPSTDLGSQYSLKNVFNCKIYITQNLPFQPLPCVCTVQQY